MVAVTVTIRRLSPQEFSLLCPQLVELYLSAMEYSPALAENSLRVWRGDLMRPGFNAVLAEDHTGILGIAYGFIGSPDTWWDRQLRRGFHAAGGPTPQQAEILRDYFELAEIHVRPDQQGRGIGRRLATAVVWNAPTRYCLLSTPEVPDEANAAFGLYRSLGFFDVLREHDYPFDSRTFAILGATLPLEAQP